MRQYNKVNRPHNSVLLNEALNFLEPKLAGIYIDATFGAGGYSEGILQKADCAVYAIDRDQSVLQYAEQINKDYSGRFCFIHAEFNLIEESMHEVGVNKVDGIVFDVGVSSMQLDQEDRGFAFMHDARLDMRMDRSQSLDAYYIVNNYSEDELGGIIFKFGGERKSRRIAKAIVNYRANKSISTTGELAEIIKSAVGRYNDTIHPATRTFQAIRIEVNNELNQLTEALRGAQGLLKVGGTLVVVTFHSLEDVIVKKYFNQLCGKLTNNNKYIPDAPLLSGQPVFSRLHNKVIVASAEEIKSNPRARSAKLRAIRRVS